LFLANSGWLALTTLTGHLALSEPLLAEDSIRYVHPEKDIYFDGSSSSAAGGPVFASLDLNGDGIIDFQIGNGAIGLQDSCYLFSAGTNEMVVQEFGLSPLIEGTLIGFQPEQGKWVNSNTSQSGLISKISLYTPPDPPPDYVWYTAGLWFGKDAYAGVKFYAGGQPYNGWIHIRHEVLESALTVVDWAYSTQPNVPILASAIGEVTIEPPKVQRPGYLRLQWSTIEGFTYQIQVKSSLAESGWTPLDFLLPGIGTNTLVDVPIGASERYYRVLKLQ
jgi:hypothetical protein